MQHTTERTDGDEEIFNSLVYASYQIPRLLLIAHSAWYTHKTTSHLTDRIAPLQSYENDAINYYSEMLFVSYDQVRQLSLFNLGAHYESLFASSLAVKYYLRRLVLNTTEGTLPLLDVYDVAEEDENTSKALADIWVDFSSGINLPDQEAFADSMNMANAIIHNGKSPTAHHDIIFPAKRKAQDANGLVPMNIAVSCKASFDLSSNKTIQSQQKISKRNDDPVDLLIWLYLGNEKREERYQGKVVFMNGNGCCNGLALDMVILTKKLISLNNQS